MILRSRRCVHRGVRKSIRGSVHRCVHDGIALTDADGDPPEDEPEPCDEHGEREVRAHGALLRAATVGPFERPDAATRFALRADSLVGGGRAYALSGRGASDSLKALNASQEFWHSWRTFQPATERY